DVLRCDPRRLEGPARGGGREIRGDLVVRREAALDDARPLPDPLVARLDEGLEEVVRDDALRQRGSRPGDGGMAPAGHACGSPASLHWTRCPGCTRSPAL